VWCLPELSHLCLNSEIPDVQVPNVSTWRSCSLCASHGAASDDSLGCGSLVDYLLDWLFTWYFNWSWRFDSSWSTDPAASALRPYIGPPRTVISLLRTARWISPLRVQSLSLLVDPLVLQLPLPTDAHCCRPADSRDACVTPVCHSTAEMWHFFSWSKVHGRVQSPVEFRYPLLHTALLPCPPSLHSLILHPWSPSSLVFRPWSPNSLALHPWPPNSLTLQILLAAPLLREFAAHMVSGRPPAAAAAYICGELFNSSQCNRMFL